MRESRCMSLLPRTTLHSDSEQLGLVCVADRCGWGVWLVCMAGVCLVGRLELSTAGGPSPTLFSPLCWYVVIMYNF